MTGKNRKSEKRQAASRPGPVPAGSLLMRLLPALAITAAALLAYSNTWNASFHFDDTSSIIENGAIKNIRNLDLLWHFAPLRFLTYATFALNYYLHGLDVTGYHIANLLIHIASALLVRRLALLLCESPAIRETGIYAGRHTFAWLSGLMFALHPVQTQAVTYIVQRLASLAALFYIASVFLYLRSRLLHARTGFTGRVMALYTAWALVTIAAFFTKETTATLPLMLLLVESTLMHPRLYINGKLLLAFSAFAALCLYVLLYYIKPDIASHGMHEMPGGYLEISRWQYLLTQLRVMITYVRLALFPFNQNLDYDYPIVSDLFMHDAWAGLLLILSLAACAAACYRRYRLISLGIIWWFVSLVTESSIVVLADVIFEHRLYLPMAGFCFTAAAAPLYFLDGKGRTAATACIMAACMTYGMLTYARNAIWRDELTLWNDTVRKSPMKARPYYCRARVHMQARAFGPALADCQSALRIDPKNVPALNNRGAIYSMMGRHREAIEDYTKLLKMNPAFKTAYFNRGKSHLQLGQYAGALDDMNAYLAHDPLDEEGYLYRAKIHIKLLAYDEASADLLQGLRLNPSNQQLLHQSAALSYLREEYDLAEDYATRALAENPEYAEAYNVRGLAHIKKGDYPLAVRDLDAAVKVRPGYAEAYNNRAFAFYRLGDPAKAQADLLKAESLGAQINKELLSRIQQALREKGIN
jgi:tetratricopeptide (TPR) repeat protein